MWREKIDFKINTFLKNRTIFNIKNNLNRIIF